MSATLEQERPVERDRLILEGAARAFGERRALAGVSLALRPGEIYALLGRNGAGKTTLIRAVCGRVRLDAGRVLVCGRDPRHEPAVKRRLGLVPQEIALYGDLTARENLEVLGRLAGLAAAEARREAARALEWIGLVDRAASRVETLSGGMKRRVNLAAGVLHAPDVLLLDEPTVGVDPHARERIHALLADLRARGMTILLTTHDLDQAATLADRIGILDEGELKAEGTLPELVRRSFGGARQLALTLAAAPSDATRALLAAHGLAPAATGEDGRRWTGRIAGALDEALALERALAGTGAAIAELALSEPNLYGVFFQVTGKDLGP